ncbi:hypothetical protein CMO90_03100 [Candidatus Woesearchaeota archaeon]|jgi:hypothetical protein|nr:hypothetical protein [Candidatus Woesearchaeota archaeon]|tara:strand:+ start:1325 stop:1654 length:330 start_codon:yes stop_codon:yes gene_type:complete
MRDWPKIYYEELEQRINLSGEYLLMKANITNGEYKTNSFLEKINAVSVEDILTEEGRKDINNQKTFFRIMSQKADKITIDNFKPNKEQLSYFVNHSIEEFYNGIQYNQG